MNPLIPIPKNQHAAGRVSRAVRWGTVGILLVFGIPTERTVFGQIQPGSPDAVQRAQELLKLSSKPEAVAEEQKPAEAKPDDAKPDAAKSEEEKKTEEDEKKKAEAKPATETAKTISRPDKPSTPADPKELQNRPDAEGRVKFNFHGQPWLGVLDWLAEISEMSLDWQELPGDFLNLKTQRSYTIREARDVINRHLLDRGFTLLRDGEVLTLVNTKKLDPSLVPRVRPEELSERDPHEFVKVSFPLDWLMAETTIEELKPLMSPNGKLTSQKATNRLEAIDAVVNLRDMQTLLREEQSNNGRKRLVKPFRLKHVRADEVKRQIEGLLGLTEDPISAAAHAMSESTGPEMMGQIQMLQQVQAQALAASQAAAAQPGAKGPPKVHMVVNARENTLLVNASADHLATISEAIEVIDQPSENPSLLQTMSRMRVYRLTSIDPEPIVKMLRELGGLEPTTRLQVDKKNRSLIVHGALADHVIVKQLIEKLDGSDRKFEVVRLRRLEADYVAGTIEFMMAGEDHGEGQNPYNPFVFYYGQGGGQPTAKHNKFRVDADTENNRLLLWANEIELQEVEKLLVKLGEIPAEGASASRRRVIESISPDEAAEFLKRLKRAWPGVSPNPLEVDVQNGADDEAADPPEPPAESPRRRQPARGTTPAAGRRSGSVERVGSNRDVPQAGSAPLGTQHRLVDLRDENAKFIAVSQRDELQPEFADQPEEVPPPARDKPKKRVELPPEETEVDEFEDSPPPPTTRRRSSTPRPTDDPSPVRVFQGPDGRLVIQSDDTAALDQLEDMVSKLAPIRRDYKIFKMKHSSTWAWGVAQNLKDFFTEKEKEKKNPQNDFFGPWWANEMGPKKDERKRLSKRRPLKFIADTDSNSIIVTGADPQQLTIIEELIAIYDVPDSKDKKSMRVTRMFTIKFSKARVIAEAIKEVYRDLLSENDRALAGKGGEGDKNKRPTPTMYTYVLGGGGEDDDSGEKKKSPIKLKGMLSIGIDDVSNTLVVSAAEGMMTDLTEMIEALDVAARPNVSRVQVMKVGRQIDATVLQERLSKVLKRPQQPQQPQQPPQPQQPQAQPQPVESPTPATILD